MATPTLFVTTSDGRLRPGNCRSTAHPIGTQIRVQNLSGSQFDPEVELAFMQVKERILAINSAHEAR